MADLLTQFLSEVSLWLSFGLPDFVAQAAPTAPVTQETIGAPVNISLWALFWQAHLVVKGVMIGLLISSVWVWAIVIDKTILYARTRRQMDRFEQAFWSGESLEDLYRTLSAKPAHAMAALFVAAALLPGVPGLEQVVAGVLPPALQQRAAQRQDGGGAAGGGGHGGLLGNR